MIFTSRNRKLIANLKKLDELEKKIIDLNKENRVLLDVISERERALQQIISEKSKGFPWLAEAIGEFYKYQDFEIAQYLESKSHPAQKAADNVREIAREKKLLRKQLKIAQYFVSYYESLFPWINEYIGDDLDELLERITQTDKQDIDEEVDPVLKFIPKSEYDKLLPIERNQKALDRYLLSRKNSYEIGRDYERYIGYLYETQGYQVEYMGIEKGLEDLGRDLICYGKDEIEIVQCKCWATHKTIHEKHINQLYGTAVKYFIEYQDLFENKTSLSSFPYVEGLGKIQATFITSTKLSETARKFATTLGVKIIEGKQLKSYPLIKCNISANGKKIYHLPFDQQYDKTLIKNNREFYAATVKEAELKGFRRAFRWHGNTS